MPRLKISSIHAIVATRGQQHSRLKSPGDRTVGEYTASELMSMSTGWCARFIRCPDCGAPPRSQCSPARTHVSRHRMGRRYIVRLAETMGDTPTIRIPLLDE